MHKRGGIIDQSYRAKIECTQSSCRGNKEEKGLIGRRLGDVYAAYRVCHTD